MAAQGWALVLFHHVKAHSLYSASRPRWSAPYVPCALPKPGAHLLGDHDRGHVRVRRRDLGNHGRVYHHEPFYPVRPAGGIDYRAALWIWPHAARTHRVVVGAHPRPRRALERRTVPIVQLAPRGMLGPHSTSGKRFGAEHAPGATHSFYLPGKVVRMLQECRVDPGRVVGVRGAQPHPAAGAGAHYAHD
jgi:hypothetical protein